PPKHRRRRSDRRLQLRPRAAPAHPMVGSGSIAELSATALLRPPPSRVLYGGINHRLFLVTLAGTCGGKRDSQRDEYAKSASPRVRADMGGLQAELECRGPGTRTENSSQREPSSESTVHLRRDVPTRERTEDAPRDRPRQANRPLQRLSKSVQGIGAVEPAEVLGNSV